MDICKKLESIFELAYPKGLPTRGVIVGEWEDKTSTLVLYDKAEEAVRLAPIIAIPISLNQKLGNLQVPEEYSGVVAIHRYMLPLGLASSIEGPIDLVKKLHNVLNAGVIDLESKFGVLDGKFKLTTKIGNSPVFRLSEDFAGIVGSIYLIKEK